LKKKNFKVVFYLSVTNQHIENQHLGANTKAACRWKRMRQNSAIGFPKKWFLDQFLCHDKKALT